MAAHRGHWTAGLRGLWCLGGGGGGRGPRRHRRKGGLTALDILPATRGYHQWDSMRDHVRPPRYTRKSVVRFRVYPTDASLFHCVHTYPLVVERRSYSLVLLFWGGLDTSNRRTCCYLALFLVVRKYYRYCYFRYYCVRKYKWNMRLQNSIAS